MSVDAVLEVCREWATRGRLDGITISGGEPFDQPEGLLALLIGLDNWLGTDRERVDVLSYSGYPERRLRNRYKDILSHLDVLIPAPYVASSAPGGRWRGSRNQSIVPLTVLGHARYDDVPRTRSGEPEIQFAVDEGIWLIGVPRPGEMEVIERRLKDRGIHLQSVSWR